MSGVLDSRAIEGLEMDIVSHDVKKFFGLLLKKNGYVLEQLYSPLVVHTKAEHAELKQIAKGCITVELAKRSGPDGFPYLRISVLRFVALFGQA